ncbi:MAG: hypothetical protein H8E35_12940 [Ardenticatenia bacterium]|nr:hypothetical protein [Ardenticatenia bacterium]
MEKKNQSKLVTSQRQDWPFSFQCPQDWELRQPTVQSGIKFFLRGPLDEAQTLFASISVHAYPGPKCTLHSLGCQHVSRRRAFRTFRLLARAEIDLAGSDAIKLDTAHEMPARLDARTGQLVTVREQVILALRDERIYELSYQATEDAFETSLPIFEALLASFRLETTVLT